MPKMAKSIAFGIFLVILTSLCLPSSADDSAYVIKSEKLPTDLNFMPTLGNGHLGYTIFGDAIFMNGVYNGVGGNSRRARLPNWLNLSVASIQYEEWALSIIPDAYELRLKDGYFRWLFAYEANGLQLQLEQRSYPHRYYNRALIYELFVRCTGAFDPLLINLTQKAGSKSEAFDFASSSTDSNHTKRYKTLHGATRQREQPDLQPKSREIFVLFSDDWENEYTIEVPAGEQEFYYRFVITADENEEVAWQEMDEVLKHAPESLFKKHTEEWHKFWQDFNIEIEGNLEMSRIINAGAFYLANSLPSLRTNRPNNPYYGLSPTGLGRGELDADYEGHNFWDTEIWMLPAVAQFNADWADQLFHYRFAHLAGARFNANMTGYRGARFPWESAYTGTEVINPCCPEIAAQEIHISPDIVLSLQQHYPATHNTEWLCSIAWPIAKEVAEFLVSRVQDDGQKYHLKDVMGPDEDHANVTDNVYTNVVVKKALQFASFTRAICASANDLPDVWIDIVQRMHILYDENLDYHPQHLGYKRGETVKQADVILLGYPVQYAMSNTTRLNDLKNYETVTRESGPAMSWSMFAINFLDVNEMEKANLYFQRGYRDYVRPEFKVWSENKVGYEGSANFLTGIGGFLQAIINGYGGIRFHLDGQRSLMVIQKTHFLPTTMGYSINGIKFAKSKFSLAIHKNGTTLKCLEKGDLDIELSLNSQKYAIDADSSFDLDGNVAFLRTI
ncbi:protein-glucosylgalactosylhydroxylysine glucosidase [Ceratitis capitata]|uniref:Protein-glucosylgalactosylhydroxylysine glucosidase n=1 Tax=Ceratitis capitata TaxID=7213 RepID=W8BFN0_CERCA|nr:protein-glucosylgalactosylhydroxylysine glucosidase [Ceratitis capitata]